MEELKKDNGVEFGLHYGLIEPLENQEGKYKYKLTEKGVNVVKVAGVLLAVSILQMLFKKVKK